MSLPHLFKTTVMLSLELRAGCVVVVNAITDEIAKMRILFSLVVLFLVSGCASVPIMPWEAYTGPADSTTVVTVQNGVEDWITLFSYTDADTCHGLRLIMNSEGKPTYMLAQGQTASAVVKRNQIFTLRTTFTDGPGYVVHVCNLITTFNPVSPAHTVTVFRDRDHNKCGLIIRDDAGKVVPREEMVVREITQPFSDLAGPWCKPLTNDERRKLKLNPPA